MSSEFRCIVKAASLDEQHKLVFGYAIVCKIDGQEYYDLQGDHISEEDMFSAVVEFMENSRMVKEMHEGGQKGYTLFSLPMTTEMAKGLGLTWMPTDEAHQHGPGWIVGAKLDDETFAKVKNGELRGFSIGGIGTRTEVIDE